jgi:hypothetical protein
LDKELPLQTWHRSEPENKFQLTALHRYRSAKEDQSVEALPLETHLQDYATPFHPTFFRVLPSCRSIRSLEVISINKTEELASISEALLQASFLRSLSLEVWNASVDVSSLPLSALTSFRLSSTSRFTDDISEALTRSKPKSLATLDLCLAFNSSLEPLAAALLECPSLTFLNVTSYRTDNGDVLPIVSVLPLFRLTSLSLPRGDVSDEANRCLLAFLSQSALQHLKLGTLSPNQLQLLADVLPSLPSLKSLSFSTDSFTRCEHESSHLALFSALSSTSLRSLALVHGWFRNSTFKACLAKIPNTKLSKLRFHGVVFDDGFDAAYHDTSYRKAHDAASWDTLFPDEKDQSRHCQCLLDIRYDNDW